MNKIILFLTVLTCYTFAVPNAATADDSKPWNGWSMFKKKNKHHEPYRPYLESTRELQIPQWEGKDWYVEDWTSQEGSINLIKGFYDADILRSQEIGVNKMPVLTVGPNFYRLSGLDKRRVTQTVDTIYGITSATEDGSFMLKDWHTKHYIGAFDKNGLRLN